MGLLDPSTSDGRVIFFLPWEKSTMAGWCQHIFRLSNDKASHFTDIDYFVI